MAVVGAQDHTAETSGVTKWVTKYREKPQSARKRPRVRVSPRSVASVVRAARWKARISVSIRR